MLCSFKEWSILLQVVNSWICNEALLIFHYASDALMVVNILAEGDKRRSKQWQMIVRGTLYCLNLLLGM